MQGLQTRIRIPELGGKQRSGYSNIAHLLVVLGALFFGSQAAGAVDKSSAIFNRGARGSAKIVRPFELKVPKHGDELTSAKSNGGSSILVFDRTVSTLDCIVLLDRDVDSAGTGLCKLYLIELH